MSHEIIDITTTAGKYKKWALEARKSFIDLRLNQDREIKKMYIDITKKLTKELEKDGISKFNKKRLKLILKQLNREIELLNEQLTINFEDYLKQNIEVATNYSKSILMKAVETAGINKITKPAIQNIFYEINTRTLEAYWSRSKDGLFLSDKIWSKNIKYRDTMTKILQTAVAEGQDCVKTARMLDQYVLKGKQTLVDNYPNMIKRMKNRIPSDVSYEALRLARTEMTAAYGEGVLVAAKVNPATQGIKYILSKSHPKPDICDTITGTDNYGLGIGVYPIDSAPSYPFHPHCLCIVLTVNEQPEDLVKRLKRWNSNPMSEPSMQNWYQNIYINMIE